ncbi:MAG: sugar transferase [Balneolaceae bacterium]
MYNKILKRLFDLILSTMVILFLFPVFIITFILVKLDSKGPFFFFQERLGKEGSVFKVFKIRTMTDKPRVANREILSGDSEVTRVGAVLRRLKIDELPQIINIWKGDMSFVGPRPCLPELKKEFDENGKERLKVRPGLSGLAQINGNIYLSWSERWEYDAEYVKNHSFLLDLKIIFKTFLIVIFGEEKFIKKTDA